MDYNISKKRLKMQEYLENDNIEFDNVINRLKEIAKIPNDRQLCFKLDILTPSFSNSKKRGVLPYKKIIAFCKNTGISLDLLFNNDNPTIDKLKSNVQNIDDKNIYNIPILQNESDFLRLNFGQILDISNLKAYLNNNLIYILNESLNQLENETTYLIKSNEIFYVRHISIDFDGMYILKDEKGNVEKLNKETFSKINLIGKIIFSFSKERF